MGKQEKAISDYNFDQYISLALTQRSTKQPIKTVTFQPISEKLSHNESIGSCVIKDYLSPSSSGNYSKLAGVHFTPTSLKLESSSLHESIVHENIDIIMKVGNNMDSVSLDITSIQKSPVVTSDCSISINLNQTELENIDSTTIQAEKCIELKKRLEEYITISVPLLKPPESKRNEIETPIITDFERRSSIKDLVNGGVLPPQLIQGISLISGSESASLQGLSSFPDLKVIFETNINNKNHRPGELDNQISLNMDLVDNMPQDTRIVLKQRSNSSHENKKKVHLNSTQKQSTYSREQQSDLEHFPTALKVSSIKNIYKNINTVAGDFIDKENVTNDIDESQIISNQDIEEHDLESNHGSNDLNIKSNSSTTHNSINLPNESNLLKKNSADLQIEAISIDSNNESSSNFLQKKSTRYLWSLVRNNLCTISRPFSSTDIENIVSAKKLLNINAWYNLVENVQKDLIGTTNTVLKHTISDIYMKEARTSIHFESGPKGDYRQQRIRMNKYTLEDPFALPRLDIIRPEIGISYEEKKIDFNDIEKDSVEVTNSKLIMNHMEINQFLEGTSVGANMFLIVHSIKRRKDGMNASERTKYPTFQDIGTAPEKVTALPIDSSDHSSQSLYSDPIKGLEILNSLISKSNLPVPSLLRKRGIINAKVGRFGKAKIDLDQAIAFG
jgi:hypothetical protein